ncbi:DEAD/DEAH box helicase [Microbacterium sp. YY-01]|uniref:DEAD/DEAH box helicase n=1 Tax=Microbacterium sp. YY-01 TaxID=3421634 RepID=UPI003D17BB9B
MIEPSPADRYAAAQAASLHPVSTVFASGHSFDFDPFQVAACHALEDGDSVLVAAPTGAGKTIVGEFAIYLAMQTQNGKAFYTTPMKALSNQKYRELVDVYGAENVGLLTGDTNVNGSARIVVMTTEVLRNMLYGNSTALIDLQFVVMDEVHYLADRFRGPVWEEVILHLPESVRLVSLSATVSNAEEFGDWLDTVRGNTQVIVSETRPVPLEQHVLVKHDLMPLFDDRSGSRGREKVNKELVRLAQRNSGGSSARHRGGYRGSSRRGRPGGRGVGRAPAARMERVNRGDIVRLLENTQLLPAIFFIFSRMGCDAAVQQVRRSGVQLTNDSERATIRRIVRSRLDRLEQDDLSALGFWEWRDNLERGVAAHHAGLLPAFKEVVEELFQRKLVKVVFATETLALGINMPARTVVLEKLEKFNGEARVAITPGEYTQLTGRAGRRGIDVEGHAVIQWNDGLDPHEVANLASRRTYPLNSSFRPTYNMAVNLVDRFGRDRARNILEASFAQFQADRAVVGLARKVRDAEDSLAGYRSAMECERGDFFDYARLRRELSDLEKKASRDVNAPRAVRDKRTERIAKLRRSLQRHSCHNCPDREDHARWAQRYFSLNRDTDKLRRQIESRTGTIARRFDRVLDVLQAVDYVSGTGSNTQLTEAGKTMQRIYGERDLLVAEALRRNLWKGLDAPGLAAMACALVYEPRRDEAVIDDYGLQGRRLRTAMDSTRTLWAELDDLEQMHHLPGSEPLASGLSPAMYDWAKGQSLHHVLLEADMAAGDFVRWAKQTIDLLDQLSIVAPDAELARTARAALDGVRRGIVAHSSL